MQETTTSTTAKPFIGVRFLLSGFDSPNAEQVRSKIVRCGGDESQDYTHLIVDNTVYDDPMCVSARENGKTVVTGLWIDHCYDTGLAVDPASIMYQPPKDFNGIPGAKNIVICLTGYQRQDREDIMTMVRLLGAQFSKPLVATNTTHLICYKFEGEKYELARRMQKIKLVNHRWLEDCLKNWKLLPEDEYNKSGYELEMMEAEAGDSEDDMVETSPKPSAIRVTSKSPQITKTRPPTTCDLSKSTSELPNMQNVPEVLSTVPDAENVLIAPVSNVQGHVSDSIAGPSERTPGSAKAGCWKVVSVSGSVGKPSPSTLNLTALSYSRRNSPSSLSAAASNFIGRSPKVQTGEPTKVSSVEVEDANGRCVSGFGTSEKLLSIEASDSNKQEINALKSSTKSHDRQACVTESSSVLLNKLPDGDPVPFSHGMASPIAASNSNSNSSEAVNLKDKSLANGGNTTLHETETQRTDLKRQSSLCESKESNSPCNQDCGDLSAEKSRLDADRGNRQGVDSLASKAVLTTLDMEQRQDDGLHPKQVKKHIATKKTLRSRLKVGRPVKNKGSVHLKESAVQEDMGMSKELENKVSCVAPPLENVERELALDDLRSDLELNTGFMGDATDPKKNDAEGPGSDRTKKSKGQGRQPLSKIKRTKASTANDKSNFSHSIQTEETHIRTVNQVALRNLTNRPDSKKKKLSRKRPQSSMEPDKENNPLMDGEIINGEARREPMCFILSGARLQRKEFQQIIKRLKGKSCKDSHQWSYQATHFIAPDPIRRTEKFFAASASGSWILKPEYLSACNQAGKFLPVEPYELHMNGLSEDGAVNLEAPRKWRLLRERTGHGSFYGMRIVVYGQCIAPPLDTLKRVVKAGDGAIVATSPPYSRFLASGGVDYAVVGPGITVADVWVQEFLRHEIPCVAADYLVEYVCKSGYSLDKHVLYNTQKWAEKSFTKLLSKAEEVITVVGQDVFPSSPVKSSLKKRQRGEQVILGSGE